MAGISGWYGTAYTCAANPSESHGVGWYMNGQLVASTYKNPSTGVAYTPQELQALAGGGTTTTTPTAGGTTPPTTSQLEGTTTPATTTPIYNDYASFKKVYQAAPYSQMFNTSEKLLAAWREYQLTGVLPTAPGTTPATTTPTTTTPTPTTTTPTTTPPPTSTLENLQVPQAPTLPPYKPTAELEALSTQVGGAISDIITQGGIGIPEETKEALFLREAEIINANTAQANRNLEDKMAAQGLSNSGMAFSESMKLASKSTIAMANVMRDVQIQDSLMKIASYQNALGLGVQFLSYLSEESWRQYQPTLYQWQAQVDMYKMAINQAYTQNNLALAHKYDMELAQFTADTNIQLQQMTIDAAAKAADKKNWWDIAGTGLGILAGITL